jgi:hypothetical protein
MGLSVFIRILHSDKVLYIYIVILHLRNTFSFKNFRIKASNDTSVYNKNVKKTVLQIFISPFKVLLTNDHLHLSQQTLLTLIIHTVDMNSFMITLYRSFIVYSGTIFSFMLPCAIKIVPLYMLLEYLCR